MKYWWSALKSRVNVFVRDYFTFSAGERNGVIVLILLISGVALLPKAKSLFRNDVPVDSQEFHARVDSLQAAIQVSENHSRNSAESNLAELDRSAKESNEVFQSYELFVFDPNTASAAQFTRLGLNDKVIATIENYRTKGGKFYESNDFKKIYGLKQSEYERLEPYIEIAPSVTAQSGNDNSLSPAKETPQYAIIDVNKADSVQLTALPGIGGVLSSRIIKFRDRLGGFYSIEQLTEVYGLKPETFEQIRNKVSVDPSDVHFIPINTVTTGDLKQHPYFKTVAQPIISYRDQHGPFESGQDLADIDAIPRDLLEKLIPYIRF